MAEVTTKTMGDRITYCRSSLCLTRKELAEKWGAASIPTLARWELDTVRIPPKKILSIIEFFYENGLIVTENWLKDGSGTAPFLLNESFFDEVDFDSLAQEQLLDINRQVKNFIFGQVKNNLLSPYIKYGDYIGGTNLIDSNKSTSIEGELVFLRKKVTGLIVGILNNENTNIVIKNFDNKKEIINKEQFDAIGVVQWIVRRP